MCEEPLKLEKVFEFFFELMTRTDTRPKSWKVIVISKVLPNIIKSIGLEMFWTKKF